ncbi:MAG: hypothetical protein WCE81_05390 [Halobacteriota archaeon]
MQTIFSAEKVLAVHCPHDVCVVTWMIGVSALVSLPFKCFERHNYLVNVLQVKGGKEQRILRDYGITLIISRDLSDRKFGDEKYLLVLIAR